jgi:hypothetical protein
VHLQLAHAKLCVDDRVTTQSRLWNGLEEGSGLIDRLAILNPYPDISPRRHEDSVLPFLSTSNVSILAYSLGGPSASHSASHPSLVPGVVQRMFPSLAFI